MTLSEVLTLGAGRQARHCQWNGRSRGTTELLEVRGCPGLGIEAQGTSRESTWKCHSRSWR